LAAFFISGIGTASLAGTVQDSLLPGAYTKETPSRSRARAAGSAPPTRASSDLSFTGTFTYTRREVLLTLTAAKLGNGGSLPGNGAERRDRAKQLLQLRRLTAGEFSAGGRR